MYINFNNGDFYGVADHTFVPHFTIAQGLTSQEFEDIYGQLKLGSQVLSIFLLFHHNKLEKVAQLFLCNQFPLTLIDHKYLQILD
jgi:hypothetical protein